MIGNPAPWAWLLVVGLVLPAPAVAQDRRAPFEDTLASLAWVRADTSGGTGVIVGQALNHTFIAVSAHLTAGVEAADVLFPAYDDGVLVQEAAWYEANATRLRRHGRVLPGRVVFEDAQKDVALVAVRSAPGHRVIERHSSGERCSRPRAGDAVYYYGNRGQFRLWEAGTARIVHGGDRCGGVVVEDAAYGNSRGGPVVDGAGRLIGLVTARGARGEYAIGAPVYDVMAALRWVVVALAPRRAGPEHR